jgi:protein-tyrosine phosphatase
MTRAKSPEQVFRERAEGFNTMRFRWEIGDRVAASARPGRSGDLAADLETLREKGIRLIVNLTCTELTVPDEYAGLFQVLHIPIDDGHPPDREQMLAILGRVREAMARDWRTLVHCRGGIGRTATVLVPLLMELEDLSLEEALRRVRASGRFTQTLEQKEFLEDWARSSRPPQPGR